MIATATEHALWDLLVAGYTAQTSGHAGDTYYQILNSAGRIVMAGYDSERVINDAHLYLRNEQAGR